MRLSKRIASIAIALFMAIPFLYGCTPKVTKYKITFEANGGSAVTAIELEEGAALTKPADPTKSNFVFGGWFKDEALTQSYTFPDKMPAESFTLYAKWNTPAPQPVALTYNLNGGTAGETYPTTAVPGSSLTLADPTKSGYTFAGWYTDEALSTEFSGTVASTATTLYAKWLQNSLSETGHLLPAKWISVADTREGNEGKGSKVYTPTVDGDTLKVTVDARPTAEENGDYAWDASGGLCYEINDDANVDFTKYESFVIRYKVNETTYPLDTTASSPARPTIRIRFYHPEQPYRGTQVDGAAFTTAGEQLTVQTGYELESEVTIIFAFATQANGSPRAANQVTSLNTLFEMGAFKIQVNFWGGSDSTGNRWVGESQFDILEAYFTEKAPIALTYNLDSGTNNGGNPTRAIPGTVLKLADPTKVGNAFAGWYTDENLTTEFNGVAPNANATLYAKWTKYSLSETGHLLPENWITVADTREATAGRGSKVYTPTVDGDTLKVTVDNRAAGAEGNETWDYAWDATVGLCYEINGDANTDFTQYESLVIKYKINATTYTLGATGGTRPTIRVRFYHPDQPYSSTKVNDQTFALVGEQLTVEDGYVLGTEVTIVVNFLKQGNQGTGTDRTAAQLAALNTLFTDGAFKIQINFWGNASGSDAAGRWIGESQFDITEAYFI